MTIDEQNAAETAPAAEETPVVEEKTSAPISASGTACDCSCEACTSGDCSDCTLMGCDDENCTDCPQQAGFDDLKRTPAQLVTAAIMSAAIRKLSAPAEMRELPAPSEDPKTLSLFIYEDIGYDACWGTGVGAMSIKQQLDEAEPHDKICVRINSMGGDVFEAVAIYNLLRAQEKPIECCIDGMAASAASVIAMAGDTVTMGPSSMMMIHNASTGIYGYASDLRKEADVLDKVSNAIARTYAAKTGRSMKAVKAMMDAETWMDAEDCLKDGFCTSITGDAGAEERASRAFENSRFSRSFRNLPNRFKQERRKLAQENAATEERATAAKDKVEVRSFKFEVRAATESNPAVIVGMPIVFNAWSQDLGGFRETILPSAVEFDADTPLRADFDHDGKYILGTEDRGTLKMTKTEEGYLMEVEPPATVWANDLLTSIQRGDISGGSFAFQVKANGQRWSADGKERTLTAIKVRRVSVVSDPAYLQTNGSFAVRSINDILADRPEQEQSKTAGQAAPPATNGGGVEIDLLRRDLELSLSLA